MATWSAGREALVNNAELAAEMTRAGAQALGLKLFAASSPAAALTAIQSPPGIDSSAIVKEFRESFAAVVANGQGEMKGKLFRIAHLGYYDYLDTIGILAALEHVLASVTGKPVEYGAAVRAAQEVYARSAGGKAAAGWRLSVGDSCTVRSDLHARFVQVLPRAYVGRGIVGAECRLQLA